LSYQRQLGLLHDPSRAYLAEKKGM
jgi:hypothetical protein